MREVEARASTAQQEAEAVSAELQELQLRSQADRENAAKELTDAQTDFQQALRGAFACYLIIHVPPDVDCVGLSSLQATVQAVLVHYLLSIKGREQFPSIPMVRVQQHGFCRRGKNKALRLSERDPWKYETEQQARAGVLPCRFGTAGIQPHLQKTRHTCQSCGCSLLGLFFFFNKMWA